jgi:FkbM family methyltransferase
MEYNKILPSGDNGRRQLLSWIAVSVVIVALATTANLFTAPPRPTTMTNPPGSGHEPLLTSSRFRTSAVSCGKTISVDRIPASLFHAQSGEDKALLGYSFFPNLCNGTYLELGALDGSTYSNTYVFHKALGWRGVLIELVPNNFAALQTNRPLDITVHAAVCNTPQTVHYVERAAVSGVWEFASDTFRQYWWKDIAVDLKDTIPIQCEPLRDILAKHSADISYFDIFSLDVEGAELEVLQSIDFTMAGFGVVLVEADQHNVTKNKAVRTLLRQNGYIYFNNYERSDWFVNERFNDIYANVMV